MTLIRYYALVLKVKLKGENNETTIDLGHFVCVFSQEMTVCLLKLVQMFLPF